MTHSLKDFNRRNINFNVNDVSSLLPEHFQTEYTVDSGSLTKLLELYYQFLDSDGVNSFKTEINDVFVSRDVTQNKTEYLDQVVQEIGNGLTSSEFFQNPRLMARILPLFYKSKGSTVGTEGFFRGFFGEEIQIDHPKDQLLYVGGIDSTGRQGQIGFENQFRITDNGVFQLFSILIKSGLSTVDYEVLYKRFAHPAGFNFAGQLQTDAEGLILLSGEGVNPVESDEPGLLVVSEATQSIVTPFVQISAIFDSGGTGDPNTTGNIRSTLTDDIIKYANISAASLNRAYSTLRELLDINSFTFDDSDLGNDASTARIDVSFTTETMDNDMFTRYLSDSAI